MQAPLVVLGAGLLVAAVALLPLRRAFVAFLAVQVLVPATFVVPNGGLTELVTLPRLVLVGAAVGLVRRAVRGDLHPEAFRATPVHAALLGLLAVALVVGIGLAPHGTPLDLQVEFWVRWADQLLVLAVVLAFVRAINDPRFVLHGVVGAAVVLAAIGGIERLTGEAYGRHFFRLFSTGPQLAGAAQGLEARDGNVRVRGPSSFTLEFGWTATMLVPAALVLVGDVRRRRRWLAGMGVALLVGSVVLTYSRSAIAALAVAALLTLVLVRGARMVAATVGAFAVVAAALAIGTSIAAPLFADETEGTVAVRAERIPIVAQLVDERPWTGVGLAGLEVRDLPATDNSYLQTYGELGLLGLVALGLVLLSAVGCALPAVRTPAGPDRLLGAAALAGVLVGIGGAGAFDLFALGGSATVFWLLVAVAMGTGEAAWGSIPLALRRPTLARAAVVAGLVLLGLVVRYGSPTESVVHERYALVTAAELAANRTGFSAGTEALRDLACEVVELSGDAEVATDCRVYRSDNGLVDVHLRGRSTALVRARADEIGEALTAWLPNARRYPLDAQADVRPVWAGAAPGWLAVVGVGAVLGAPSARLREREGVPV